MSRRKFKSLTVPSPALGTLGAQYIRTDLPQDPVNDRLLDPISLSEDFIDAYNRCGGTSYASGYRANDIAIRRNMLLALGDRCGVWTRGTNYVTSELNSRSLVVSLTGISPSASDIMNADKQAQVINNAIMHQDGTSGLKDFIAIYVRSLYGSKTGAFLPIERSGDRVINFSILPPESPFPAFGVDDNGNLVSNNPYEYPIPPTGIYYLSQQVYGRTFHYLPAASYIQQTIWGSNARGPYRETRPPLEMAMSSVATYSALEEYIRRTLNRSDRSQLMLMNNVDTNKLRRAVKNLNDIDARVKRGEPVPDDEKGSHIWIEARDADKPASIASVDLRYFAKDFNPETTLAFHGEAVALSMGLDSKHVVPKTMRDRMDSTGQQALVGAAATPGLQVIAGAIEEFFTSVVLKGMPARADLVSAISPENYTSVNRDLLVAQTMSQAGLDVNSPLGLAYARRQGLLVEADENVEPAIDSTNGAVKSWARLVDHKGMPIRYERIAEISTKKLAVKASPDKWQSCYDAANARVQDWIDTELPTVIDQYGLDKLAFREDVDGIAVEIANELKKCALALVGKSRDIITRTRIDKLADDFLLLWGSPLVTKYSMHPPKNNFYESVIAKQNDFALGRLGVQDLQKMAQTTANTTLERYFNSTNYVASAHEAQGKTGPVSWVMDGNVKNCSDCQRIAGDYPNMDALLKASSGRYPRDPSLLCSGNCKCVLKHS